jgi:hypothetical protein
MHVIAGHASEGDLLRLARGRAADVATAAHVAGCAVCQEKLAAATRLDGVLGAWQAPGAPDLAARVLEAAAREGRPGAAWYWTVSRVAAALVLSAGVGVVTGRALRPAAPPPSEDAAAHALQLDAFTPESGLLHAVLDPAALEPGGAS